MGWLENAWVNWSRFNGGKWFFLLFFFCFWFHDLRCFLDFKTASHMHIIFEVSRRCLTSAWYLKFLGDSWNTRYGKSWQFVLVMISFSWHCSSFYLEWVSGNSYRKFRAVIFQMTSERIIRRLTMLLISCLRLLIIFLSTSDRLL